MRRRILAVIESGDPMIKPAARAAAAALLRDPASLSDSDISELSEALARFGACSGVDPRDADLSDSTS